MQPHEDLPDALELPDGVQRWRWIPVHEHLRKALNLHDILADPGATLETIAPEEFQEPLQRPDANVDDDITYYAYILPDDVQVVLAIDSLGIPFLRIANRMLKDHVL